MISGLLLLIVEYILISLLSDPVCEASAACRCVQLCVSCPHGRPWIFDYGRDYASSKSLSGLLKVCVCLRACARVQACVFSYHATWEKSTTEDVFVFDVTTYMCVCLH